jgi:rhodanese-related sulfurtransferase
MAVKDVSVRGAHALQGEGATYVDVRSVPEFAEGHPAGAVNVPLLHADPHTGQMTPNPDFLAVIKANFAPGTPLLLGCRVGRRSAQAAHILANAGYTDLTNVLGGWAGAPDGEGWMQASLPTGHEAEPGRSYQALLTAAEGK